jgi:hypothetical protein
MKPKVVAYRGFPESQYKIISAIVAGLHRISSAVHPILVRVVPGMVVTDADGGGFGWGAFRAGGDNRPQIIIPGHKPDELTDAEWLAEMLPTTIAHEWAHYEQYRDGKPVQERGVVVRARSLARGILENQIEV